MCIRDSPYDDPIAQTIAIAQATATNQSSMLSDVLRGFQTEIDAICGEIVRHGKRVGVPTPVNQAFLEQLLPQIDSDEEEGIVQSLFNRLKGFLEF